MDHGDSLFSRYKWVLLLIPVLLLAAFVSLNQPAGEKQYIQGTIVHLGISQGEQYSFAQSVGLVELRNGETVQVFLPRSAALYEGARVSLSYQSNLFSGGVYAYSSTKDP